jgi:hypothetical protein
MKVDEEASASIIAFRCDAELRAAIERQAAEEGLSNSAVARRAVLRDLRAQQKELARAS